MKFRQYAIFFSTLLISQLAAAQPASAPPGLEQLPPGRLQAKIATLPAAARARALDWLARFDFPIEDLDTLDVDENGAVLYADPRPDLSETISEGSETVSAGLSEGETFTLHSRPGASNVVYLDVDGHTITGTAWNAGGESSYVARAYDRDGDPSSFSQSELDYIAEIWHRIAEDLAPFDIDVTTEEPTSFGPDVGRILITHNQDANGIAMPYASGGGVAYVGQWGQSNYTYYQPALVYYNNLGGGQARYVAEASSHELGHNLGLSHDGTTSGITYYAGHGSGFVNWAPIMGNSYGSQVSQWSRGEYNGANNTQDDTAIIANKLSLRADDHGDTLNTATPLDVAPGGIIEGTDPEIDPFNDASGNKGVIEVIGDIDVFSFSTAGGSVDFSIAPAWLGYRDDNSRGANLDIEAGLFDSNGVLIASNDPALDTFAEIQLSIPGGVYYLAISAVGAGTAQNAYDEYAAQGMYFINGLITPDLDNIAPVANDDSGSIDEDGFLNAAVLANDNDPDGDTLSIVSIGQASRGSASTDGFSISYAPNANQYGSDSFSYVISDGRGGTDSATLTININSVNDAPNAVDDNATVDAGVSTTINVLSNDSDVDSSNLTIASTTSANHGSVSVIDGTSIVFAADSGYAGNDAFTYTVDDGDGASAIATVNLIVRDTIAPPVAPSGITAANNENGSATITWQSVAQAGSYEIQRETKHKRRNAWNGTSLIGATTATSYLDSPGNNTYRYRVRSVNEGGASGWSSWAVVTITNSSGGGGGGNGNGKGRKK